MISAEEISRSMIQDCVAPVIAKDINDKIISFNKAAEKMLGYQAGEILGRSIMTLVAAERSQEELSIIPRLAQNERICDLTTVRLHKDGHLVPVALTISPILDANQTLIGACNIMRPCMADALIDKDLLYLAFRDPLTGLSNRTHLLDRLNYIMRRNERTQKHAGVFFIDLDNFKTVNDTAGHEAGDKLLKQCARRLQSTLREYDTIARWGGDEFLVLIDNLPEKRVRALELLEQISQNLLHVLRKPYLLDAKEFHCSATIGVSLFQGVVHPIESIINQADRAMYQVKLSGKNSFCVHRKKTYEKLTEVSLTSIAAHG